MSLTLTLSRAGAGAGAGACGVLLAASLAGVLLSLTALAQAWATKPPIRLLAVLPPGGSVDPVARSLAPVLQQRLGQAVIVDNMGGASGSFGTAAVAIAVADGYTVAVAFDTHGVNPGLLPSLPYGSIGSGSLGLVAMTMLAKSGPLSRVHVPYRGGGPLMSDASAGQVPLAIGSVFVSKPHIDSQRQRLRPLAVATALRNLTLADMPTVAESGFAGFDAPAWWAVLAPGKTPSEIVERLNEEINAALRLPEVAQKLEAQGITIAISTGIGTPAAAQAFIEQQIDSWAQVGKANKLSAD